MHLFPYLKETIFKLINSNTEKQSSLKSYNKYYFNVFVL